MSRTLWIVSPRGKLLGLAGWKVEVIKHGSKWREYNTAYKIDAVNYAVDACNYWLKKHKENSELIIMNRTGKISKDKRTYGDDPKGNG